MIEELGNIEYQLLHLSAEAKRLGLREVAHIIDVAAVSASDTRAELDKSSRQKPAAPGGQPAN